MNSNPWQKYHESSRRIEDLPDKSQIVRDYYSWLFDDPEIELTKDIEEIFKLNIKQCIATGGMKDKTAKKIDVVKIRNYFPDETVFTADMVEKGKPEPDLFLLAAKSFNYKPEECVVVEDSVAGIKAAIKANITPILYFDGIIDEKSQIIKEMRNLGVKYIFNNMKDIKNKIIELF